MMHARLNPLDDPYLFFQAMAEAAAGTAAGPATAAAAAAVVRTLYFKSIE